MAKKKVTYKELINTKRQLRKDISSLEGRITDNKLVSVLDLVMGRGPSKKSALGGMNFSKLTNFGKSPIFSLASSFLLYNKRFRKYVIAFFVLKEAAPYVITRVKDIVNKS
ncbi:MAG: hypothetical protein KAH10_04535 [Flavobacteriales bacterium]|nr:hypothetical protein [Flavobacteriales bacterium]